MYHPLETVLHAPFVDFNEQRLLNIAHSTWYVKRTEHSTQCVKSNEWAKRVSGRLVELEDIYIWLVISKQIFSGTQEFVSVYKIIAKWIFKYIIAA